VTTIELVPCGERAAVAAERRAYLASLPEFQELFLERLVERGTFHRIVEDGSAAGHVVVGGDGTDLLEFRPPDGDAERNAERLSVVASRLGLRGAYCKSFDRPLLEALDLLPHRRTVDGILFRRRDPAVAAPPSSPGLTDRVATAEDLPDVLRAGEGFFDSADEAAGYVRDGAVVTFADEEGGVVGVGLHQRIADGFPYIDVGMAVDPSRRGRGIGTRIVRRMAEICDRRGAIPICGCASGNVASRRTLERAGFVAEHELLRDAW